MALQKLQLLHRRQILHKVPIHTMNHSSQYPSLGSSQLVFAHSVQWTLVTHPSIETLAFADERIALPQGLFVLVVIL